MVAITLNFINDYDESDALAYLIIASTTMLFMLSLKHPSLKSSKVSTCSFIASLCKALIFTAKWSLRLGPLMVATPSVVAAKGRKDQARKV